MLADNGVSQNEKNTILVKNKNEQKGFNHFII